MNKLTKLSKVELSRKPLECCSICKKFFTKDKLEKWGDYYFCESCIKLIKMFYGKPKDRIDIVIPRISYSPFRNTGWVPEGIKLYGFKEEDFNYTLVCISHETLHYVINKIEGLRASYNFDSLAHNKIYGTPLADGIFLEGKEE